jgi:hypothetical protein
MSSSMDKSHGAPAASPRYETSDADVRGVFTFLVVLSLVLIFTALLSWGMFKYFSTSQANRVPASPFAGARQLPAGPQLQVNPRQDLLRFRAEQEHALESYSWENRDDGTVRVPIERAMELLLQKGLPVAPTASPTGPSGVAEKPSPKGSEKR